MWKLETVIRSLQMQSQSDLKVPYSTKFFHLKCIIIASYIMGLSEHSIEGHSYTGICKTFWLDVVEDNDNKLNI